MEENWKIYTFQFLRFLFVIVVFSGLAWLFKLAVPLLYPFIIGFIIAVLINRPVRFLQKKTNMPRWAAVSMILFLAIVLVAGLFTVVIAQVAIEISQLIALMPVYIQDATDYVRRFITQEIITNFYDNLQHYYYSLDSGYKSKIEEQIGAGLSAIAKTGTFLIQTLLSGLQHMLTSLPNTATVLVISLLAAFFISKDFDQLKAKAKHVVPPVQANRLSKVTEDLRKALFGFIRAQFTLISITGFIVIIGLLILRVEYAFTIGIITGIVDLLPLLGTGFVFVPWIIYLFIQGNYSLVIGLSILYGVVIIQRQIMEPKIVADNIGLDPLVTLIALFVGLQLIGVAGLILGPVTVVVINALKNAGVFRDLWSFIKGPQVK